MNLAIELKVKATVTRIAIDVLVGTVIRLLMAFGGHKREAILIVIGTQMLKMQMKRNHV
jgi:hypothetical protein